MAKSEHAFCSQRCSALFYNRKRWANLRKGKTPIERSQRGKIHVTWVTRHPRPLKPLHRCKTCDIETKNPKYCSGTCRNKDLNRYIKGNRSKAEMALVAALKTAYPSWTIDENNRSILDGLELDVYIPEIKLAIEWNGIFHFEPIRGHDGLERVMRKDDHKVERCRELGIELIVICDRTSHDAFIRETVAELVLRLKPLYQMAG